MTVARLRSELTNEEFLYWVVFFQRRGQEMELQQGR